MPSNYLFPARDLIFSNQFLQLFLSQPFEAKSGDRLCRLGAGEKRLNRNPVRSSIFPFRFEKLLAQ